MIEIPEDIGQQLKQMSVPRVSIVDSNKKPATIDDYDGFMGFLMLASMNANLTKIRRLQEDQESSGEVIGYDVAVTDQVSETKLSWPAQSISLLNTSANPVKAWVNHQGHPPRTMRQNTPLHINFGGHKLKSFYLQCGAGLTATVEVAVKY